VDDESCLHHWTAVRCLAHFGECDGRIVLAILRQLFASHGQPRQLHAANHLIALSEQSVTAAQYI